jgi:hypothetical protein
MTDALRRSLVLPERDQHEDRLVIEARAVTSTGHVVEHGARVQPAIERYARRGQLTMRQVRAAEMLYRSWATGVQGAKIEPPGCTSYSPTGWNDAQIQALRSYENARQHVGLRLWPLVWSVVCADWTADRFANECGRNSTSTMEVLRYALDMVGDAFGLPEG